MWKTELPNSHQCWGSLNMTQTLVGREYVHSHLTFNLQVLPPTLPLTLPCQMRLTMARAWHGACNI